FLAPRLSGYFLPRADCVRVFHSTRNITRYNVVNNRVFNQGVQVDRLQRVVGRPVPRYQIADLNADQRHRGARVAQNRVAIFRPQVDNVKVAPPPSRPIAKRAVITGAAAAALVAAHHANQGRNTGNVPPATRPQTKEERRQIAQAPPNPKAKQPGRGARETEPVPQAKRPPAVHQEAQQQRNQQRQAERQAAQQKGEEQKAQREVAQQQRAQQRQAQKQEAQQPRRQRPPERQATQQQGQQRQVQRQAPPQPKNQGKPPGKPRDEKQKPPPQ
ncbi:MAG: hypothetical protein ACREMY_04610, partial [bacterium]